MTSFGLIGDLFSWGNQKVTNGRSWFIGLVINNKFPWSSCVGATPKICLSHLAHSFRSNNAANTVDGSKILLSPVEVGSLSPLFTSFF